MKLKTSCLASILSANYAVLSHRHGSKYVPPCDAPPDLGKGQWSCTNEYYWDQGDICTISNDGCSGSVRCSKGNWKGKYARFVLKIVKENRKTQILAEILNVKIMLVN